MTTQTQEFKTSNRQMHGHWELLSMTLNNQ